MCRSSFPSCMHVWQGVSLTGRAGGGSGGQAPPGCGQRPRWPSGRSQVVRKRGSLRGVPLRTGGGRDRGAGAGKGREGAGRAGGAGAHGAGCGVQGCFWKLDRMRWGRSGGGTARLGRHAGGELRHIFLFVCFRREETCAREPTARAVMSSVNTPPCLHCAFHLGHVHSRSSTALPRVHLWNRSARQGVMPPKQHDASRSSGPGWLIPTAHRLDVYRATHDAMAEGAAAGVATGTGRGSKGGGGGKGKGASVVAEPPAATTARRPGMPAWQRPWSDQGVAPPGRMPETPDEELQALRCSRHAPASFAIARKAVMICGRPTVVLGGHGVCVSCQIVDSHASDADPHSRAALQVCAHRRTERGEGPHAGRSCRDPRPSAKWRHGLRECGAWAGRLREENRGRAGGGLLVTYAAHRLGNGRGALSSPILGEIREKRAGKKWRRGGLPGMRVEAWRVQRLWS